MRKPEHIIEEPVDPNIKVPNGRTTFEGAKRRLSRVRSELSETRPDFKAEKPQEHKTDEKLIDDIIKDADEATAQQSVPHESGISDEEVEMLIPSKTNISST